MAVFVQGGLKKLYPVNSEVFHHPAMMKYSAIAAKPIMTETKLSILEVKPSVAE
jgi:hypothetical protein